VRVERLPLLAELKTYLKLFRARGMPRFVTGIVAGARQECKRRARLWRAAKGKHAAQFCGVTPADLQIVRIEIRTSREKYLQDAHSVVPPRTMESACSDLCCCESMKSAGSCGHRAWCGRFVTPVPVARD